MARILARKREREKKMREKEMKIRMEEEAKARKIEEEKRRLIASRTLEVTTPSEEPTESKSLDPTVESGVVKSSDEIDHGVAKLRWKRVDGKWEMIMEATRGRDDMANQREALKTTGSQTILEIEAANRWKKKQGGTWRGQFKGPHAHARDDATFYQSKITLLHLPNEAYGHLDITDALHRPGDFRTAIGILRILFGHFFSSSSMSTQHAMLLDVEVAQELLGKDDYSLENHYSAVVELLESCITSVNALLGQKGYDGDGEKKEEEEGNEEGKSSTIDPFVRKLLLWRSQLTMWYDVQSKVLQRMEEKRITLVEKDTSLDDVVTYIPPELLINIFASLPIRDLGGVCSVCHTWSVIGSDDMVFHQMMARDYPSHLEEAEKQKESSSLSWKEIYRSIAQRKSITLRGICRCTRCHHIYWRVLTSCSQCGASTFHDSSKVNVNHVVELLTSKRMPT